MFCKKFHYSKERSNNRLCCMLAGKAQVRKMKIAVFFLMLLKESSVCISLLSSHLFSRYVAGRWYYKHLCLGGRIKQNQVIFNMLDFTRVKTLRVTL